MRVVRDKEPLSGGLKNLIASLTVSLVAQIVTGMVFVTIVVTVVIRGTPSVERRTLHKVSDLVVLFQAENKANERFGVG